MEDPRKCFGCLKKLIYTARNGVKNVKKASIVHSSLWLFQPKSRKRTFVQNTEHFASWDFKLLYFSKSVSSVIRVALRKKAHSEITNESQMHM